MGNDIYLSESGTALLISQTLICGELLSLKFFLLFFCQGGTGLHGPTSGSGLLAGIWTTLGCVEYLQQLLQGDLGRHWCGASLALQIHPHSQLPQGHTLR